MCLPMLGKTLQSLESGLTNIAAVQFGGISHPVFMDFVSPPCANGTSWEQQPPVRYRSADGLSVRGRHGRDPISIDHGFGGDDETG